MFTEGRRKEGVLQHTVTGAVPHCNRDIQPGHGTLIEDDRVFLFGLKAELTQKWPHVDLL